MTRAVGKGVWAGVVVEGLPLHEERQLRVGLQSLDPELLPAQLHSVRPVTVAVGRAAAEALLELGDVLDADHPAEPAAAGLGASLDRLPERGLVGGRVVETLDDLDIALVREREDDVASAEPRVDSPVDGCDTDELADAFGGREHSVVLCCIGHMVDSHSVHRDTRGRVLLTGVRSTNRRRSDVKTL